jgi:3-hydroxybutyrate dehydrogenase
MRLSGKVAIITGAAQGIGRALAERFGIEGAKVVVTDLDSAHPEATAREIGASTGAKVIGLPADVTDEEAVERAVDRVVREFGGVDILVSNAGIQIISSIDKLSYSNWKKVLSVHLDGAFLTTRACLRRMYDADRGGAIIYMGSVHSKLASVFKAPYVTSKHGLLGLCRAVAKEAAPHRVSVNVICPGFVRTQLVEKQIPEQATILNMSEENVIRTVMLKDTLDGQFTTTDEIADAAVFLASANSLAYTGQSLTVSHGWSME